MGLAFIENADTVEWNGSPCLQSVTFLGWFTGSIYNYFFLLNALVFDLKHPAFGTIEKCEGFCLTFSFICFLIVSHSSIHLIFKKHGRWVLTLLYIPEEMWRWSPFKHRDNTALYSAVWEGPTHFGILDKKDHWRGKLPFTSKAVLCMDESLWEAEEK